MAFKVSGLSTRSTSLRDQARPTVISGYARATVLGGSLPAITISGASVAENTAAGTVIGTLGVADVTGTPTFTLVDNAGGLVALSGGVNIVRGATALDFETTTFFDIVVGVSGVTPAIPNRTIRIAVVNVFEVTLAALTLSASSIAENSGPGTVVGNIQNKTSGSTLSLTSDAGGRFALNGSNQIVAGLTSTDFETATSHSITIRETHPDALPRDTVLTITVTDVDDTTVSGTLAATGAADTAAMAGGLATTGTVAGTEAADTATIGGATGQTTTGTLAATEAADTAAASGGQATAGTLAATGAADTAAGTAGQATTGTLAATEAADTAAIAATGPVTWNPSDKEAGITLSDGDLTATSSTANQGIRATLARSPSATSYYFEVTIGDVSSAQNSVGLANASLDFTGAGYVGDGSGNSFGWFSGGYLLPETVLVGTFGSGDVIGIEMLSASVKLYNNGVLLYTRSSLPSGALYPAMDISGTGGNTANFGATALAYLPSGTTSWDGSRVGTGSITGTLAATGAPDTAAMAGGLATTGTLAATGAPDTAAIAATGGAGPAAPTITLNTTPSTPVVVDTLNFTVDYASPQTTDTIHFEWTDAADTGFSSAVNGDADADPGVGTAPVTFDVGPFASGSYLFRSRVEDALGNFGTFTTYGPLTISVAGLTGTIAATEAADTATIAAAQAGLGITSGQLLFLPRQGNPAGVPFGLPLTLNQAA